MIRCTHSASAILRMSNLLGNRGIHWKASAPFALPGTTTYAAQNHLPRLPVPSLPDTLSRLKPSLRPFAESESEYNTILAKIDQFEQGIGPKLQERLLERARQTEHWLEEWWDDAAYLAYRDSVVINVSYYYGFDQQPSHLKQSAAMRAACIARATMLFRRSLKRGGLQPDKSKEGPICMDTYRWMFDCCRIPGTNGYDWSVTYAKPNDQGDSGHMVVFRRNRPWKVELAQNGRLLSSDEIEQQIQYIYDNTTEEHPGIGVLAASNRDTWAKDFQTLSNSSQNRKVLEAIHSAAFTLSLDSYSPSNEVEHSRSLWHGHVAQGRAMGLENRWVDKPVQFIVFDNAYAGLMGEHSVMDGTPTVRLCDDILNMIADPSFDHGRHIESGLQPVKAEPLDWEITPEILKAIEEANKEAVQLIESQVLGFHLTSYGKVAIKKYGVSPDSWAQMIVQLAYKRLRKGRERVGGTYEAATTRRYYKGRTEAIRVVTNESDAWVASMDNPAVDVQERKRLFDIATAKHVQLAKMCGMGQGIDRHLLGLKKLLRPEEPAPELFSDPVYLKSSYWVLSTSAVFSKHFPVYGWGEVVPDGFGVAYMTGYDDRLQYTLTSRKEMPNAEFCREISQAAIDVQLLHDAVQRSRL